VFLEFLCVRYVILFLYCVGKISFTKLKHREVHLVIVLLPHVFWILFEDVRGFSSGLDMRTDVHYSDPERLLTKPFPVPWGVTTIVPNTSAYRNQYPTTHCTKYLCAGQSVVFPYWCRTFITYEISFLPLIFKMGRDNTVGIATRYGMDGPGTESRWEARIATPVQTGLGAYPASYTMGTGIFPGGKAVGAWRWPSTPILRRGERKRRTIPLLPSGPSWPVPGWTLLLPLPLPPIFKSAVAGNPPGGFET
jgi:hypothetical protein